MRRARLKDAREAGRLWLRLLESQGALDPARAPGEDALERWLNDFSYWVRNDQSRVFVAEEKGRLAGFLKAHVRSVAPIYAPRMEVYLEAIYVVGEARRRGTGRKLVQALAAWAAGMGGLSIRLQVEARNDGGRAFWRSVGAMPSALEMCIEPARILAAFEEV